MNSSKKYKWRSVIRALAVITLCLLLLIIPFASFTQNSMSFFGGITYNDPWSNYPDRSLEKTGSKFGLGFGMELQHDLGKTFSICTGLSYLQKNYKTERTGSYSAIAETFSRSYIQMPLFARIRTAAGKFQFNFDGGAYGAYWVSGRLKGRTANPYSLITIPDGMQWRETLPLISYNEKYVFSPGKDRRMEFGAMAATGCELHIGKRNSIFINLAYYHALTSDQKEYTINQEKNYNRTIYGYAGFKLNLKE